MRDTKSHHLDRVSETASWLVEAMRSGADFATRVLGTVALLGGSVISATEDLTHPHIGDRPQ